MSGTSVDLRGFSYPLDALLKKRRWELDALQAELSAALSEVLDLESSLRAAQKMHEEQSVYLAKSVERRLDPQQHLRALSFLMQSSKNLTRQENRLLASREKHASLREKWSRQQQRVDMLEDNLELQLQEYVSSELAKQASEVDRDWSARSQWRLLGVGQSATRADVSEGRK